MDCGGAGKEGVYGEEPCGGEKRGRVFGTSFDTRRARVWYIFGTEYQNVSKRIKTSFGTEYQNVSKCTNTSIKNTKTCFDTF